MQAAPLQLTQLGLDPATFRKATHDEYHGPCPFCGGKDRFRVRTGNIFPHWWWACRQCGKQGWADQLNSELRKPISDKEKAEWAAKQRERESKRIAELQQILSQYTKEERWIANHNLMLEEQRRQWRNWGVQNEWQDYLQLGYTPHYSQSIPTPAYTIPYFHNTTDGRQFSTMQYRLVDAPNPEDRYRFAAGLPSTYYETRPTDPLQDHVIICEGAKKAINLKFNGEVNNKTSVLAVPSKNSWGGVEEAVKGCGRVWVLLDPDGTREAHELAKEIGGNARIVELPAKIDDLLINGHITNEELRWAFKWAVKA